MLNLSSATRVFVATAPVDLRGSFNRLAALTQSVLSQDPISGHWFVFTNRRRNRVKILFWDGIQPRINKETMHQACSSFRVCVRDSFT